MRTRSPLFWLLTIVSIPFILIILIIVFMKLNDLQLSIRGYHVMSTGWELGRMLAKEGGSAKECLKFRSPTFDIMTPSRGEHVGMCVREYAELTKDPSACELLMPSSYGLSCVGAATSIDDFCHFYNGDENVYWDEAGDAIGKTTIRSCQKNDPLASDQRNQCCLMARVRYVITENDCSSLEKNSTLYDECQNNLAIKNRDPEACSSIDNENLKTACLVRATAMKESPTVCQSCRESVINLSELE